MRKEKEKEKIPSLAVEIVKEKELHFTLLTHGYYFDRFRVTITPKA